MRRRGTRGQSLSEYAVLVGIVTAAVVGMQLYVKRGVQAKLKTGVDHWLATSTMANGNIPQDCLDEGIGDPVPCAQFLGAQLGDKKEIQQLEAVRTLLGQPLVFSTTNSHGQQAKQYSFASDGSQVTITRNKNGTSINRKINDGLFVSRGLPPPEFLRRPKLPSGLPSGSSFPSTGGTGGGVGGGGGTLPGDPNPGPVPGEITGPPAPGPRGQNQ